MLKQKKISFKKITVIFHLFKTHGFPACVSPLNQPARLNAAYIRKNTSTTA